MVSITILVDGEESVVVQQSASEDSTKLVGDLIDLLERFRLQAAEPCAAGQKCTILKGWIGKIEEVMRHA